MKITLPRSEYEKLLAHARANLPEEACGLIAGTQNDNGKQIKKVFLLTNTDHSNEHFTIDPKEHLAAVKEMRAAGLVPLGNWHSHPESPSRPSEEDKRLAYDSKASLPHPLPDGAGCPGAQFPPGEPLPPFRRGQASCL